MSHIFISYSHKDSEYAHKLADSLQERGLAAWIDDRIDYGTRWPRVIQEHVDTCSAFIVIMTPNSYESEWVQNELTRAKRKHKSIFPLLLEGSEPWLSVEATQYCDVRTGELPPVDFYVRLASMTGISEAGSVAKAEAKKKWETLVATLYEEAKKVGSVGVVLIVLSLLLFFSRSLWLPVIFTSRSPTLTHTLTSSPVPSTDTPLPPTNTLRPEPPTDTPPPATPTTTDTPSATPLPTAVATSFPTSTLTSTPTLTALSAIPTATSTPTPDATSISTATPTATPTAALSTATPTETPTSWVEQGWVILRSFPAPSAGPTGIVRVEDDLWVSAPGRLYRLDLQGDIIAELDLPIGSCQGCQGGLAWDGESLWCASGKTVHQLDPLSEDELTTFVVDLGSIMSIAWDGQALLMIDGKANLVRYDRGGQRLRRLAVQSPHGSVATMGWVKGELWIQGTFGGRLRFDSEFVKVSSPNLGECSIGSFPYCVALYWDGDSLWLVDCNANRISQCAPAD